MKKIISLIILIVVILHCKGSNDVKGRELLNPKEVCVNRVVYYKSYTYGGSSSLTPKFLTNSQVEVCDE